MSRKKYSKAELNGMVLRTLDALGLKKKKELAELLGESQQALSNKIATGGIVDLIEKEAYKRSLNFHYLLTGEGTPYAVQDPDQCDAFDHWPEEIKHACRQVRKIMQSDHPVIKPALISNLAAFEYSIEQEKTDKEEVQHLNRRVTDLERMQHSKLCTGTDGAASSSTGRSKK